MAEHKLTFGDALRLLREHHGYTQGRLGELAHTHQSTIARLERSSYPPKDPALLRALAEALHTTPEALQLGEVALVSPGATLEEARESSRTELVLTLARLYSPGERSRYTAKLIDRLLRMEPDDQALIAELVDRLAPEEAGAPVELDPPLAPEPEPTTPSGEGARSSGKNTPRYAATTKATPRPTNGGTWSPATPTHTITPLPRQKAPRLALMRRIDGDTAAGRHAPLAERRRARGQ